MEFRLSNTLHRRTRCRLCESKSLELVVSLTSTPLANAFVPASELDKKQELFPLDVFFCCNCGHAQLLDVVDPVLLFENYVYVSGTSPVSIEYFRTYAEEVITRFNVPKGAFVLDIGSNDGTLLRFFKEADLRVLGVDPAKDIARAATQAGIETLVTFFTPELATEIKLKHGRASVIMANNVFAHADDLKGIVDGIRHLLTPDGLFVFEVSYLVDVYRKTLFDTIYHEHLSYHTVKPLRDFFARNDMEMIETVRIDTQGGSLHGIVQLAGGERNVGISVTKLIALEAELGLDWPGTLQTFSAKIEDVKTRLRTLLLGLTGEGKKIAAYGAAAKATTLMYHFDIGPDILDFIVDDSPLKQGLYSPGYHIPVLPSSAIYEHKPDYLLILAWNFAGPIMAKHTAFTDAGGHFIVPLPQIEMI